MNTLRIGKILYGLLFMVIVPLFLIIWAKMSGGVVRLPIAGSIPLGAVIALFGAAILVTGMATIIMCGNGLPMNAYPPGRYVSQGIYRLTSHPIYLGFCLLCIGCAIMFQSSSGVWLISPIAVLGCTALVQGYESKISFSGSVPCFPNRL